MGLFLFVFRNSKSRVDFCFLYKTSIYDFNMSEDLASKIRKQVEFYFSGLNLRRDKFMREKMSADPEGCIVHYA